MSGFVGIGGGLLESAHAREAIPRSPATWITRMGGLLAAAWGIGFSPSTPAHQPLTGEQEFCQLVHKRTLAQIEEDGNLQRLLCALSDGAGHYRDVALEVRDAFDRTSAVGVQLDMIGTVVGLAREGFTDERYRVFLEIQANLLLSGVREDGFWTGTGENILRIARTFVGSGAGQILLVNEPPYSYELSVPNVVISEAQFLARFLRTANYAAVIGLLLIGLDDSVMGSNAITIPLEGIMGSDSVVVAGAFTMGTVVTT